MMDYGKLRAEQAAARARGVLRGIGIASFVENSNPSAATYGQGGVSIASQDSCTFKLTATGGVVVAASVNEAGQGTGAMIEQIAATALGVPIERVKVVMGDTDATPYGGGNWGSRGTGIGGEAVLQAGKALKANIVSFVARLTESEASLLDIREGNVVGEADGATRMSLEEVARTAYFRTHEVPKDFQPELTVTRSYAQKSYPGAVTNGIQASLLEVDRDTGFVKLLRHWVVDDCGTIVNPLLVDEQIRGACVQGIGAALYEQCIYSPEGQLLNGSLRTTSCRWRASCPTSRSGTRARRPRPRSWGRKARAKPAPPERRQRYMNAVNDALKPLGARVLELPITPERVLSAIRNCTASFRSAG